MQSRFAVILLALFLLGGIAGSSPLWAGAIGITAGDAAPPSGTMSAPPIEQSRDGNIRDGRNCPRAGDLRHGHDPDVSADRHPDGVHRAGLDRAHPAASWQRPSRRPFPPATSKTSTSTQAPTRTGTEPTPRVTDTPEKVSLSTPVIRVTIHLSVLDDDFSPSSITVPAGAEVTIVFDNQDVGVPHNVVVYADKSTPPIFAGTVVKGPGIDHRHLHRAVGAGHIHAGVRHPVTAQERDLHRHVETGTAASSRRPGSTHSLRRGAQSERLFCFHSLRWTIR